MDHLAIMKKEWRFIEKILNGSKAIESRWYKNKYAPWDRIKKSDIIYFKEDKQFVKAKINKVLQFSDLTKQKAREIFKKYRKGIGQGKNAAKFLKKFCGAKYCVLIFLKNPQRVKPFKINKKRFGTMASWITVKNIRDIKT